MASKQEEDPKKALADYINNPKAKDPKALLKNLFNLCQSKTPIQFRYDGHNICQLSGEIIGQDKYIDLEVTGTKYRVKVKHLKPLIQQYCFWDNIFEWQLSTLYNVQLISDISKKTTVTKNIDITLKILEDVYDDKEYQKIKEQLTQFYQESDFYYEQLDKQLQFFCPITGKQLYNLLEGINIQGRLYSFEGALKIYKEDSDKLFDHQKEFLGRLQEFKAS